MDKLKEMWKAAEELSKHDDPQAILNHPYFKNKAGKSCAIIRGKKVRSR